MWEVAAEAEAVAAALPPAVVAGVAAVLAGVVAAADRVEAVAGLPSLSICTRRSIPTGRDSKAACSSLMRVATAAWAAMEVAVSRAAAADPAR
jgi:hypothetical protein